MGLHGNVRLGDAPCSPYLTMMVAQEDRTKKKDEILAMEKMNDALQDKIRNNKHNKACIFFGGGGAL